MRYPVGKDANDFKASWNLTAGYGFGDKTDYGFHEGRDINKNGGGDIELGEPIYAIADGEVTSVHDHVTNFGKHLHYHILGDWGERYVHDAHCSEILVKVGDKVKEGQIIARIGKTGTTYAHDHHAIKRKPTGIDSFAKTQQELNDGWEDPTAFEEKWMNQNQDQQQLINTLRQDRDRNWTYFQSLCTALGVSTNVDVALGEVKKLVGIDDLLVGKEKQLAEATTKIGDLEASAKELSEQNKTLIDGNLQFTNEIKEQKDTIIIQGNKITTLGEEINDLKKLITMPVFSGWKKQLVLFLSKI